MVALPDMLAKALEAHAAGLSPVPPQEDGSKRPMGTWKRYIDQRPDEAQIRDWYGNGRTGIGTVCGRVAGNLEVLEFEGLAVREGYHHRFRELCNAADMGDVLNRIIHGYSELSPSGGYHLLYRVPTPKGNTKLARRPATAEELAANPDEDIKLLAETRGEGGYIILAPSYGKVHPDGTYDLVSGSLGTISHITDEERDELWRIVRLLDDMPDTEPTQQPRPAAPVDSGDLRPGDDYNVRAGVQKRVRALLEDHGWRHVYTAGDTDYLRRPGKTRGISATLGHIAPGVLRVFTTSTVFEDKAHSPFSVYTILAHGGDASTAAQALRKDGYGSVRETPGVTTITTPPPPPADDFWTARPILEHIRTFAQARRASPWATLGVILARTVVAIPPHYVLPRLVGGYGSLNLFVGIVGRSGAGKGAAEAAARDALDTDPLTVSGVGSGEGVLHQYAEWVPPNKKTGEPGYVNQHTEQVLLTCAEVDTLGALHSRQSSTLLSILRSVWVGEELSFAYVDKTKALRLAAHTYRAGLIVGIQPARASVILDDAGGGTPQRFLWFPAADPHAPDRPPDEPAPLTWGPPLTSEPTSVGGEVELDVCKTARDVIDEHRLATLRNQGDELDTHALFAQLKTAAALALLEGRRAVNDEDWELAGQVAAMSLHTRQSIVSDLQQVKVEANKAKGFADAARDIIREETVADAATARVCQVIKRRLGGGEVSHGNLRRAVTSKDRGYFEAAIDRLVGVGDIEVDGSGRGVTYRAKGTS